MTTKPRASRDRFLTRLRADHSRLARVLSLISRESAALTAQPHCALPLLREALEYVVSFQDAHHHPHEDRMFQCLAQHCDEHAALLDTLLRQHRQGRETAQRLAVTTARADSAPAWRLAPLARALEQFAGETRAHIDLEEELLYSGAEARLTARDWDAIELDCPPPDPLTAGRNALGVQYPHMASYFCAGQRTIGAGDAALIESLGLEQLLELGADMAGITLRSARLAARQCGEALHMSAATLGVFCIPRSPYAWIAAAIAIGQRNAGTVAAWADEWRNLRGNDG